MATPSHPHAEHARKTIDYLLAQREEILAAFIAKHGFHPDQAIQIEQRQADGSTTWRIEKRQAAPAPAAAGEVAELVGLFHGWADAYPDGVKLDPQWLTRAADLLERQAAPVPVNERLPGPEDCDAEGRCWLLTVEDEYPQWRLHSIEGNQPGGSTMIWVPVDSNPGVMVDAFYASHWLPATALPLPQGEVEE